MAIVRFNAGDTIVLKKKHPCSSDTFCVQRGGSDVKIKCLLCSHELTLPRETLEKSIKRVIPSAPDEK